MNAEIHRVRADDFHEQSKRFWLQAHNLEKQTERERILLISKGIDAKIFLVIRHVFTLTQPVIAEFANISTSTLERKIKNNDKLDVVASERVDRLMQIALQAEDVFEDRQVAIQWMGEKNKSLGDETPISLCRTELGARQVRRVLNAIEWGGAL